MNLLTLKDISFSYHTKEGETLALKDVSFSVEEGEFVGIVGPSGCGKTTVLNLLCGLEHPSCGSIFFKGEPLNGKTADIGYMPQRDQLFPWRTVKRNVLLGPEIRGKLNGENKDYALALLKKYGLGDFVGKYPNQLSGGMRQRAALIRTLVNRPSLLLLDEPFSALDFQTRLAVCDDVHAIIKQEKKTAVLVSHDINECISLCDKIVVFSQRPASVLSVLPLSFADCKTPLQRREHRDFGDCFKTVLSLLEVKNE